MCLLSFEATGTLSCGVLVFLFPGNQQDNRTHCCCLLGAGFGIPIVRVCVCVCLFVGGAPKTQVFLWPPFKRRQTKVPTPKKVRRAAHFEKPSRGFCARPWRPCRAVGIRVCFLKPKMRGFAEKRRTRVQCLHVRVRTRVVFMFRPGLLHALLGCNLR